jgi:predicted transcriptional regulator
MNLELQPELERRLRAIAQKRSQSLSELVEEGLRSYLEAIESESSTWVETTQNILGQVWTTEDFRDWNPPDGR